MCMECFDTLCVCVRACVRVCVCVCVCARAYYVVCNSLLVYRFLIVIAMVMLLLTHSDMERYVISALSVDGLLLFIVG